MKRSPPPNDPDGPRSTESPLLDHGRVGAAALALAAVALLTTVAAAPAVAQSDDGAITLDTTSVPSTADATVAGTTTLDPGTELQIRVRSTGETEPAFIRSTTATVGPDGTWNATVDLSAVDTHDRLSVAVSAVDGDATGTFEASLRDDEGAAAAGDEAPVSTPGFGVVAAVVALLGGATALARR